MPRGNRTGPRGFGPRTGRGLGYCAGYSTPGYTKGSGMGLGRGQGRSWRGGRGGWRSWRFDQDPYYSPPDVPHPYPSAFAYPLQTPLSSEDESEYLKQTLSGLKKDIELIENRLEELDSKEKG